MMKRISYTYDEFLKDALHLIQRLDGDFDTIVAVARGGLTFAHLLSEALHIRNIQSIQTEFYDEMKKRDTVSIKGKCDFSRSKKILIVDDIADSGETLKALLNYFHSTYPDFEFKTVTIFYKKSSVFKPNYWVREAEGWIDFFWETDLRP